MSEYSVTHILGEPIICETCHEKVRQVAAFEPHYICVDCAFDALAAENARLKQLLHSVYDKISTELAEPPDRISTEFANTLMDEIETVFPKPPDRSTFSP